MCDAICDGGVRCSEPADARRARQRIGYAISRAGGTTLVRPSRAQEPLLVEVEVAAPPSKPDLAAFGFDHAAAEVAVTAWGAELARRAFEIAGITPEDILAGSQFRQRQAELALPELEEANREAGLAAAALRRQLVAPAGADPELVTTSNFGERLWGAGAPQRTAYQDALDRSSRVGQSYREALLLVQAAGQGKDEETIRQLDLVSAACLQVLEQERPMGGKVDVGKQSSPRAKAALADAMRIFPTAWITASNEAQTARPLMAVANPGRAFYSHEADVKVKADGVATRQIFQEAGWTPAPTEAGDYELDEPGAVVNGRSGAIWREKLYEKKYQRDRPRGPGWEPAGDRIWRRPKTGEQIIEVSELRVGLRETLGGQVGARVGASTAAHEFGHRCQRLVPGISELERAFLDRRTEGTELEPYTAKSRGEWVQPDGFASRYMGKDYRRGGYASGESKATEVLTTGVEALFANRFGSFMGLNGLNADPDMRNFVLGLMATL